MVTGIVHVNMDIQDKSAVYVQMDFTRNGMVVNIYAQVGIRINFFRFIAVNAKFIV